MIRLRTCAALVASGLILAPLGGCGRPKTAEAPAPLAAVEAVTVGAPSGPAPITATGSLRRRREMMLSFRIPGVITHVSVDDGDTVRRGQTIATLDPTEVLAKLRQTAADLAQARRDAARSAQLVLHGDASRQRFEAQRTLVTDAQAAYEAAAFDQRWATLTAPASGVVLSRVAQSGEVVVPGQAIVSIADEDSSLVLRVPLADRDIGRVRLGDAARVTLGALPGEALIGQVSLIGQRADPQSGVVQMEVSLPPHAGLRSGLIARAVITSGGIAAAPPLYARLPAEGVLEANGSEAFVLRLEDATTQAHRVRVAFGGFDGDDALVAGLPAGARVITAGAGFVADGQQVAVVSRAAGPVIAP